MVCYPAFITASATAAAVDVVVHGAVDVVAHRAVAAAVVHLVAVVIAAVVHFVAIARVYVGGGAGMDGTVRGPPWLTLIHAQSRTHTGCALPVSRFSACEIARHIREQRIVAVCVE